ncbi:GntR family transcriptional regulator [Asanoa iriomotensis]|uniref:HTH gntR-type domain-containing protein n=1 Tax=Asanoa iriomotensis TaxID=234613 RepID=A0ABQ4C4C2_9ACTN|nr:GntR family transcriptional regulator [Asanoa iriomotensis]GIF57624.1 hypothetical protein Air01nite_37190 [Asanoa iriomotensis]
MARQRFCEINAWAAFVLVGLSAAFALAAEFSDKAGLWPWVARTVVAGFLLLVLCALTLPQVPFAAVAPPAAAQAAPLPIAALPATPSPTPVRSYPTVEPVWRTLEPLHRDGRPLTAQIAQRIAQAIDAGRLEPDAKLPSQGKIATHYGVSKWTAYDAIEAVVKSGHVRRRAEGGYAVNTPNPQPATPEPVR